MEVLQHVRPYSVRIFPFALYKPYIGQVPPIQVPEMAIDVGQCFSPRHCVGFFFWGICISRLVLVRPLRRLLLHILTSLSHLFVTHTLFVTHNLSHTHLCHTPSFTHIFVTHHLSHTSLSHTHHLSHTSSPSFTHPFVTHHFLHTSLVTSFSHTSLSHIFVTHPLPQHPPSFCVASVVLMALSWVWWRALGPLVARDAAWQVWH